MANPTPKATSLDPNYEKQVRVLQAASKQEAEAIEAGNRSRWYRPDGLTSLGKYEDLSGVFQRDKANETYESAVKDPENPGVDGDLRSSVTQIDVLNHLERAVHSRMTMSMTRSYAMAASRLRGHGHETGLYGQGYLEYVRGILKQSSA